MYFVLAGRRGTSTMTSRARLHWTLEICSTTRWEAANVAEADHGHLCVP